jgi:hypothetical protein
LSDFTAFCPQPASKSPADKNDMIQVFILSPLIRIP